MKTYKKPIQRLTETAITDLKAFGFLYKKGGVCAAHVEVSRKCFKLSGDSVVTSGAFLVVTTENGTFIKTLSWN